MQVAPYWSEEDHAQTHAQALVVSGHHGSDPRRKTEMDFSLNDTLLSNTPYLLGSLLDPLNVLDLLNLPAIVQPVASGPNLWPLEHEGLDPGLLTASKVLVNQFIFAKMTGGTQRESMLRDWGVEGMRYNLGPVSQVPSVAFRSGAKTFLGPTDVKNISADSVKNKGFNSTSSQVEFKIDGTPFYLLQRSTKKGNNAETSTLRHFMLCIKEDEIQVLNDDDLFPYWTHFHCSFSEKSGSNLKSKSGSQKYKVFTQISYYLLEPESLSSAAKKRKVGEGTSVPVSTSAPNLTSLGLSLQPSEPLVNQVKVLEAIAKSILCVIFSSSPNKVDDLTLILSSLSLEEAMNIQLPYRNFDTPRPGIIPPGDPHINHQPPLIQWLLHPSEAHCYDLDASLQSTSSSAADGMMIPNAQPTIDLLGVFEECFGAEGLVQMLMQEDKGFGATALHRSASSVCGMIEVIEWIAARLVKRKMPLTRSGFAPYHEAARAYNFQGTVVCLKMLLDSWGSGQLKDFVYGLNNKWMERKNLDQVSPNEIIKMAGVQLGFMGEDEELDLLAKKEFQIAKLSLSL